MTRDRVVIEAPKAEDDAAIAPLVSSTSAILFDEASVRDRRVRLGGRPRIELVARDESGVVGWFELARYGTGGSVFVRVAVAPEARRSGFARALYQAGRESSVFQEARRIVVATRDNEPHAWEFAEREGFVKRAHSYESTLDLDRFNPDEWWHLVDRARANGIEFVSVADLGDSEEVRKKLWYTEWITDHDIPGVDPADLMTWEEYCAIYTASPYYDPAGEMIAIRDGDWVGICGVSETKPRDYYNQHTGVLKEHRGQGIAAALKVVACAYAKQKGGLVARTHNDSRNAPMIAINRKMGYEPQPGHYELVLERQK